MSGKEYEMGFEDPYKILELMSKLLNSEWDDEELFEIVPRYIPAKFQKPVIIPILKRDMDG